MFEIKANPLRVSATVFTAIIIVLMFVQKCAPGRYEIPVSETLNEEISGNPVTLQELRSLLGQQDKNFLLVDIRTPEEFNAGHLQDAVNIPTETLFDKKNRKILRNQENIIYCSTESMAHSAAFLFRQCGFDCRPVNGNYDIIQSKIIDKFDPAFGFFSEEKQQYNFPLFIKQQEAPAEFKVDKKEEIKIQSGC
jgi:rhodanese-related sulfurtransferase